MNLSEIATICGTVFCIMLMIVFSSYYKHKNRIIAEFSAPMTVACAMDAEMTATSPACAAYLARVKL